MEPNTKHALTLLFSFNQYSQSTYYVLGILLGTGDIDMS